MSNYLKKLIILFLGILLLTGCSLLDDLLSDGAEKVGENSIMDSETVTPIAELVDIEHFRKGTLEHILEGELNKQGNAVGFHYDRLPTKKGKVIPGTETETNEFGVYEAKVEVSGVSKTSNGGKSTFFPDDLDTQQVVDAINEAYGAKTWISGNTFEGLTSEGMVIRMYLDQKEKIISAFPVY